MLQTGESSSTFRDDTAADGSNIHEAQRQGAGTTVQVADWTTGYSPGQFGSETDRSGSRGSGTQRNMDLQSNAITSNPVASGPEQQYPETRRQSGPVSAPSHRPTPAFYSALRSPDIQIDDVIGLDALSFFTSLFLNYNYSLCPLTHTPTFARALAVRRDKHDRQFRAFLLGLGTLLTPRFFGFLVTIAKLTFMLVTYTIGQSPIGRLTELCPRPSLEKMQKNCHRASMLLHDRKYESPSLHHIGTLIL